MKRLKKERENKALKRAKILLRYLKKIENNLGEDIDEIIINSMGIIANLSDYALRRSRLLLERSLKKNGKSKRKRG